MGLFGQRKEQGPTVAGRAVVVPRMTFNEGINEENVNNLSANARVKSATMLVGRSAEDGQPVSDVPKGVKCRLPNWQRHVMHDAGSNEGQWKHLPAELEVPVWFDVATREIVDLDEARAEAELLQYRDHGVREFKETEAFLAPVRFALKAPGKLARLVPEVARDWKAGIDDLLGDLKGGPMRDEPVPPKELEQYRRTAVMQRSAFASNPARLAKVREQTVPQGPSMAAGVVAGSYPRHAFALWLMMNETNGVFTPAEAAELRAAARLPADADGGPMAG